MSTNWLDVITSGSVTVGVPRQTSLTNAGLLAVLGHASLHVDAVGSFTNQGTMLAADGGTMTIFRGAYRGLTQVVQNTGLIEATGDGTIDVKPGIHSVLANSGQIDANGGTIDIKTHVSQSGNGVMAVAHNGTLELDDKVTGGTIQIDAGMLNIGDVLALTSLSSTLIFTGSTGTLEFAYAQSVSENYSEIFHSLVATVDYGGGNVVTKEIALPASGYAAADFSVHGTDILFTNHPTS